MSLNVLKCRYMFSSPSSIIIIISVGIWLKSCCGSHFAYRTPVERLVLDTVDFVFVALHIHGLGFVSARKPIRGPPCKWLPQILPVKEVREMFKVCSQFLCQADGKEFKLWEVEG